MYSINPTNETSITTQPTRIYARLSNANYMIQTDRKITGLYSLIKSLQIIIHLNNLKFLSSVVGKERLCARDRVIPVLGLTG